MLCMLPVLRSLSLYCHSATQQHAITCAQLGKLYKMCEPCENRGRSMRPPEMIKHKYQISVDGFTSPFDAFLWKMASNSVVFAVNPSASPLTSRGAWIPGWFHPLYEPGRHYMSTTVDGLLPLIKWCTSHDAHCEQVMRFFRCRLVCFVCCCCVCLVCGKMPLPWPTFLDCQGLMLVLRSRFPLCL